MNLDIQIAPEYGCKIDVSINVLLENKVPTYVLSCFAYKIN